jgi:hypothetical protein
MRVHALLLRAHARRARRGAARVGVSGASSRWKLTGHPPRVLQALGQTAPARPQPSADNLRQIHLSLPHQAVRYSPASRVIQAGQRLAPDTLEVAQVVHMGAPAAFIDEIVGKHDGVGMRVEQLVHQPGHLI